MWRSKYIFFEYHKHLKNKEIYLNDTESNFRDMSFQHVIDTTSSHTVPENYRFCLASSAKTDTLK